jgi:AcrR family transcriptional regulator
MLNMRSVPRATAPATPDVAPPDDRTARARIRDAAIERFAADGMAGTSVRAIAADAGVSPALVIHHFGSKDALRAACDEYVATAIAERKHAAMAQGPSFDPLAALRAGQQGPPLLRYLARSLLDPSPQVAALVDGLVADAAEYMAEGVRTGVLRPTDRPFERAAVLTLWSLGALALHDHVARLLAFDPAGADTDLAADNAYFSAGLEILGTGLLTEEAAAHLRAAFAAGGASPSHQPSTTKE